MQKLLLLLVLFLFMQQFSGQTVIVVSDSITNEKIIGAVVRFPDLKLGGVTNLDGKCSFSNLTGNAARMMISFTGYKEFSTIIPSDKFGTTISILLVPTSSEVDAVVVTSTRTNSRIDDLPMKVEVLGSEDMDEESTIVPGNIGSILGDLAVITIQRTNPVNGNDAVRMQGLDYKYTQMLRDGLPLYDGFSGSIGVLAIPPLDLKQVEIIKGSSSTLYGGGAIGGMINFVSKTPCDTPSVMLTLNRSSLNESNLNTFISKKNGKTGITLVAGANLKESYDVNKDGFSEVPQQRNYLFHPRFFFDPNAKNHFDFGLTINSNALRSGDMNAIASQADSLHPFLYTEKINRTTFDGHYSSILNSSWTLNLKGVWSNFQRNLNLSGFQFDAMQWSSYNEANALLKRGKHSWVSGVNLITEQFDPQRSDSIRFRGYNYNTIGVFTQEDWQINEHVMLTGGVRADYHNRYHLFVLPRVGLFLRPNQNMSIRLNYGSGYKVPNLFTSSQPGDYRFLLPVADSVKAERSNGLNADINYRFVIGEVLFTINQAFYYTTINPVTAIESDGTKLYIQNTPFHVNSAGTDSYVRVSYGELQLYLGYNHTDARQKGNSINNYMPFNPRDKFAATLAWDIEGWGRCGIEAAYNANQYIYNNERVPNYWFYAAMVEKKFKLGSIVLNCENLGNFKQSTFAPLYAGSKLNPIFRPIWGPIEGRVINLSIKISL
jgi:iron complex outermembrane receptor protein/outer membrane receptor for ferrienterochelin and colicins